MGTKARLKNEPNSKQLKRPEHEGPAPCKETVTPHYEK